MAGKPGQMPTLSILSISFAGWELSSGNLSQPRMNDAPGRVGAIHESPLRKTLKTGGLRTGTVYCDGARMAPFQLSSPRLQRE
jgi:hypothetical protein